MVKRIDLRSSESQIFDSYQEKESIKDVVIIYLFLLLLLGVPIVLILYFLD